MSAYRQPQTNPAGAHCVSPVAFALAFIQFQKEKIVNVFQAAITSLAAYDDCDQVHCEERFANVLAAEAWIASKQAAIAPESDWLSSPSGDSSVTVDGTHYWASISKETVFDSFEEACAAELDRIERMKRRLGLR